MTWATALSHPHGVEGYRGHTPDHLKKQLNSIDLSHLSLLLSCNGIISNLKQSFAIVVP